MAKLLSMLDGDALRALRCHFGGGTAVALLLDEYRESVDIDLLCSDKAAWRMLRTKVFDDDIDGLFRVPVTKRRETRADMDGVRNFIDVDGTAIKFEIVHEARIELDDSDARIEGITMLSTVDLFAEKLLANTDRGLDTSTRHRDAIDLLALASRYRGIPELAWRKSEAAYGASVRQAWARTIQLLGRDRRYFEQCLTVLSVDAAMWPVLQGELDDASGNFSPLP